MDFISLLNKNDLKATPQRISILKILYKNEHPTVDDLYDNIKKEYPSISLATVYKNIHTLKESNLIVEVNMPNCKARYDIYTKPHAHIVCEQCGYIEDIECSLELFNYQKKIEAEKNLQVKRVDIVATLSACKLCS